MPNQYHDNNVSNFESESLRKKDLHSLSGSLSEPDHYITADALSSLRGDPDHLALLNILYRSVRCIESEVSGSTVLCLGPEHSDDILRSLCRLLVCGTDPIGQTDTDEESIAHKGLPNRVNAIQSNDDSSTEEENVFFTFLNWRNNIQLLLPLYSSLSKRSTFRLARQIVEEYDLNHAPWLSDMIIPLFKRWQSEERLRLYQLQQQGSKSKTGDSEKNYPSLNPPRVNKWFISLQGSCWMKEFLGTITTSLMERMIQRLVGICVTIQGCSGTKNLVEMFGLLSMEARSYRTLCAGALALLGYQWVELVKNVQQRFAGPVSGTTSTGSAPSASRIIVTKAAKSKHFLGWLWQRTAVQHCAQRHALELWKRWVGYFLEYDYASRKTDLDPQEEADRNRSSTSSMGSNMGTPKKNDKTSSAALSESQWLFLLCLVLHTENILQTKKENMEKSEINSRNSVSGRAMDPLDTMMWALECFSRKLLEILQEMANSKVDAYAQEGMSSIDASSSFYLSYNRVIIRDFFFETVQQMEVQATGYFQSASQRISFWSSLFSIYAQLTAIQEPNEETVVASLSTTRSSGMSAHDDGHHMLEDVLNSIREAYYRCSECALHESMDWIADITKGPLRSGSRAKEACTGVSGKRQRCESSVREGDTQWITTLAGNTPDTKLNRYLSRVFYSVYHSSCFPLLLLERQKQLKTLLFELHSLLFVDAHRNLPPQQSRQLPRSSYLFATELAKWTSSDDDEESIGPNARDLEADPGATSHDETILLKQHKVCPMWVACRLLARDARFVLMLSHAVLVLLERCGKVAEEVGSLLTEALIPTLVTLSADSEVEANLYHSNLRSSVAPNVNMLNHSIGGWSKLAQSTFCLYALIHSGLLMALPWSVEGIYLTMARYRDLTRYLLKRYWVEPEACIAQLEGWTREGGDAAIRQSTTSIRSLCDDIDNFVVLHDPVLRRLKNRAFVAAQQRQQEQGVTASFILDECVRSVTPLFMPPPCGTLLVLAFSRRLFQQMYYLRNAYEMQQRLLEGDSALEYLGRRGIFCTAEDIEVFKVTVRSAHRMIFATQLQPVGLLQLWIGMLAHLFIYVVPMAESDEGMELMPRSWQLGEIVLNCFAEKVPRTGWRALRPSSRGIISSQTTLRVMLGELLAELFLMPMFEANSSLDCLQAFPVSLHSHEWSQKQQKSQIEVQCILPHVVLEVLCLFLRVNTEVSSEELTRLSTMVAMEAAGGSTSTLPQTPAVDESSSWRVRMKRLEEKSFLGLAGLVALCKQIEKEVVPGTFKDSRLVHLLRCIWAVADLSALEW